MPGHIFRYKILQKTCRSIMAKQSYRKNYVAEVTRNIAKLLSGRRGVSHDLSKKPDQTSFLCRGIDRR